MIMPLVQCQNAKKMSPSFDSNFSLLIELFEFDQTSVRDTEQLFCITNATVSSSPNHIQALTGIDKHSLEEGLIVNKTFGCNIQAHESSI